MSKQLTVLLITRAFPKEVRSINMKEKKKEGKKQQSINHYYDLFVDDGRIQLCEYKEHWKRRKKINEGVGDFEVESKGPRNIRSWIFFS